MTRRKPERIQGEEADTASEDWKGQLDAAACCIGSIAVGGFGLRHVAFELACNPSSSPSLYSIGLLRPTVFDKEKPPETLTVGGGSRCANMN